MNSIRAALFLLVSTSVALASDTAFVFPTYGVSVTVPETLQRIAEGGPAHVGRWAKLGTDGAPEFVLAVESSPVGKVDLETYAKKTAEAVGGSVSTDAVELDGVKGLAAMGAPTGTEMRPLEAVMVERDGMFYLLTRTGKNAEDGKAEFAGMKQSWKWIPVEPVMDHLAMMAEPVPVFDNLFSFRPPTLVRPYEVKNPKNQISLGIYNVQTKSQDFFLNIDVVRKKPGMSLDQVGESFAATAAKNFKSKDPITWERRKDGVEYLLSKPITAEMAGTPTAQQTIQFLVFVTQTRWVVLTSAIAVKDEAVRQSYLALIDEVGRTIAIPEKSAEEKPGEEAATESR